MTAGNQVTQALADKYLRTVAYEVLLPKRPPSLSRPSILLLAPRSCLPIRLLSPSEVVMWGCSDRLNSARRYSWANKSSRMLVSFLLRRIATSICSSKCFKMGFIVSCSRKSFRHFSLSDPYVSSQARRTSSGLRKNIFEVYVVYKNIRSNLIRRVPLNAFSLGKGHRGSELGNERMVQSVAQGKQGLIPNYVAVLRFV